MKRVLFGIFVLAAGTLLLAFNLEYLPQEYKSVVFSWQSLLIAFGLINIVDREHWVLGLILTTIGTFFMIPMVLDTTVDVVKLFWPALLILIGLIIVVKKGFKRSSKRYECNNYSNLEEGVIEEKNVFSGSKRVVTPQEFKGGKISNVFGGTELDLRQCTLAPGKNYLKIECVFGGVSLMVPNHWKIIIEPSAIMGGFVDKRQNVPAPTNDENEPTLIVKVDAVFGGGEIKSI